KSGKLYTGIIAVVDMAVSGTNEIIPHEKTLAKKEQRQITLLLKRKATVKPVLLTYPPVDQISFLQHQLSQGEPHISVYFQDQQERHSLWSIYDANAQEKLRDLFFRFVPKTYIADGHHRCATAKKLSNGNQNSPYSKVLCGLFPSTELEIHDFNRVVDAFTSCSPTYFMARLSQYCDIKPIESAYKPKQKHELLLLVQQEWYQLRWKSFILDQVGYKGDVLDTQLINDIILHQILGIRNVSSNPRVRYIEGPKGLQGVYATTQEQPYRIGLVMYPIQAEELFRLTSANTILPAKSTWFEPRLKNGIVNLKYEI
ncbi:MAG: DUF1015 family protein, partial [Bacteroidota bacterium]